MDEEKQWNFMLFDLGRNLKKKNIKDFISLMPSNDLPEMEQSEIKDGHDLLKTLERKGLILPDKVTLLKQYLPLVGRTDLKNKVVEYEKTNRTRGYPLIQESKKDRTDSYHCSEDEILYQMKCNPHGNCIIFNIVCDNIKGLSVRTGTEEDRKRLERLFTWLKYKVSSYNLNVQQIRERLNAVANDNNMECDSLVVIILSHGDNEGVYGSCGGKLSYDELFRICDTELLKGKPKLFFVSACQVYNKSPTQNFDSNLFRSQGDTVRDTSTQNSGIHDLYCFTSTTPGSLSIREKDGTWFAQTLCDVFEEHASTHALADLEVKINNAVSKKETQINIKGETVTCKMIPNIKMNTLFNGVCFNPECTYAEFCEKNNIPTQQPSLIKPAVIV